MKHLLFDLIIQKHVFHLKSGIFPYVSILPVMNGVCSNYYYWTVKKHGYPSLFFSIFISQYIKE